MNDVFGNIYHLTVDIKGSNSSIIPRFNRSDTCVLRFKVTDNFKPINFEEITHAEITLKRHTDEATFIDSMYKVEVESQYWFQHILTKEQLSKESRITVIVSLFQGDSKLSSRPISMYIEDDLQTDLNGVTYKDVVTLKDHINKTNLATQRAYEASIHIENQSGNIDMIKHDIDEMHPLTARIKTSSEIYDEIMEEIEYTPIPIDMVKYHRIQKLKEECTNSIFSGFMLGDNWFGFNSHDQDNMTQQLLMILMQMVNSQPVGNVKWKTLNNGIVEMTANEFISLTMNAELHKRAEQNKYWNLEQMVLASDSSEEIDSIKWDDFDVNSF